MGNPASRLSFAAYRRGEGTRQQRAAIEKIVIERAPELLAHVRTAANAAAALAQVGVLIDDDEDLQTLVARLHGDQRAAPVLALLLDLQAERSASRGKRVRKSEINKLNATSQRCDVEPEQVREYMQKFERENGTQRGARTAAAANFNIDLRTIKKLLQF